MTSVGIQTLLNITTLFFQVHPEEQQNCSGAFGRPRLYSHVAQDMLSQADVLYLLQYLPLLMHLTWRELPFCSLRLHSSGGLILMDRQPANQWGSMQTCMFESLHAHVTLVPGVIIQLFTLGPGVFGQNRWKPTGANNQGLNRYHSTTNHHSTIQKRCAICQRLYSEHKP